MKSEKITFTGALGAPLAARLDLPEGPVRAAALFAHCFTCSKDIAAARRISGRLTVLGIAVLRFDFTGLGHSGGEFANTGFSSNVGDLLAAARWMEAEGHAPQLIIGHSLGGAAVIKAAPEIAAARAIVTIGAPSDPAHVAHSLGGKIDEIRAQGSALVDLAGRKFEIRKSFLDDIASASLDDALANLGAALLVLHAPRDQTVGIDNAARLFTAARHPKSYVSLDDADHLLTGEADAGYAAEVIAAWAKRYLALADEPATEAVPEGIARVSEAEAAGFRQDVTIGSRHQLIADEPASVGGTDLGPSPYQLLAAALGACTTMTLRMYAGRKGLALDHVSCDVTHGRSHREDSEGCERKGSQVDVFHRQIRVRGSLSSDDHARLLDIADKCPVHRTLHAGAVVETEIAAQ